MDNHSSEAVRTTIEYGEFELEVFQLCDQSLWAEYGKYRLSQSQILKRIDEPKNWITRLHSTCPIILQSLKKSGFTGDRVIVQFKEEGHRGRKQVPTLSMSDAKTIWGLFATKGNPKAQELLGLPITAKTKPKSKEKICQLKLQAIEGGQIEVTTPVGDIDLLTNTELVEIKITSEWKCAIGQLILYGYYFPLYQKRLHLFGVLSSQMEKVIQQHCDRLGIRLTFD